MLEAIAPAVGLENTIARWNEIAAALGERNRKTKTADIDAETTTMKPTILESTTLATVAYDADRQLLQIEFRDRTAYRYFNLPTDVYETLLRAPSKGSYFNRVIRGQFAYVRMHACLDRGSLS